MYVVYTYVCNFVLKKFEWIISYLERYYIYTFEMLYDNDFIFDWFQDTQTSF